MAIYIVTKVRKELADDGTHRHIAGVCTDAGTYYSRKQVVDSIGAENTWKTSSGGYEALIEPMKSCPRCPATPYIKTHPDSDKQDNLENLPEC